MQHQSQGLSKGPTADTFGILESRMITGEEIERHIAAGKRMQAEAIAAALSAAFRRLGLLFQRRQATSHETALPHGA